MIENCTLYLSKKNPPLKKILPDCKSDGGLLRKANWYEYVLEGKRAKLNLMPESDLENHLEGLLGYVFHLLDSEQAKAEALERINKIKAVLGVTLEDPISADSPLFHSFFYLIQVFDGFMFINGSIVLPDGNFWIDPHSENEAQTEFNDSLSPDDFRHQGESAEISPQLLAMRERHYFELAQRGFHCARWLPLETSSDKELRPLNEILGRVNALNILFHWVVFTQIEDKILKDFIERNQLLQYFTASEQEILSLSRTEAQETHLNTIGWKLENMWALSWVLGFEPAPPFYLGQMQNEHSRPMLLEFLPNFYGSSEIPETHFKPRSLAEIFEFEDLYYCAHNAVRSAQMGKPSVPKGFHPIIDGGAISERRQALTWCLSPGIEWDATDLST